MVARFKHSYNDKKTDITRNLVILKLHNMKWAEFSTSLVLSTG